MPLYTVDEIARRIAPVATKYALPAVYLFGSYARGDATAESDIDLLVDLRGTPIKGLFSMTSPYSLGGLCADLEEALGKRIDLVTLQTLEQPPERMWDEIFRKQVLRERVMIYAAA